MTMRYDLVAVCDAYCATAGIGRKRLSTIILKGGAKLDQIADGADLYTGTYERAMGWLSEHWPKGTDWPEGIDRPLITKADVHAAQDGGASDERHGNDAEGGFRAGEAAE